MDTVDYTNNWVKSEIPDTVIEGHYKYSTRFLLPLMHGRDLQDCNELDRNCFRSLNVVLATHLNWSENCTPSQLHNYQHALIPLYLSAERAESIVFFWGIAWAESFTKDFQAHAEEIARSLLRCNAVAFRTLKDLHNFARFVRLAIPQVTVVACDRVILHVSGRATQLFVMPESFERECQAA